MPLEQMMWVEKYRPERLADLANQEGVKERLRSLMAKPAELPHLLFAGPPGCGKTTTAMIVAREVLGADWREYTLSLNASDERGIDMVRERVKTFARFVDRREGVPFRLVVLDEADEMTSDAQTALRRIMEDSSGYTRFILLCNYSSGIIEPLQSRTAIFRFRRLDEASVVAHLKRIAKDEKLDVQTDEALAAVYEATQGDLRQAINMLQASATSGAVTLDSVKKVAGTTARARVAQVIGAAVDGDFEGARARMVELTRVYGVPERDFLKFASEAVGALPAGEAARATRILAEYDFRLVQGAQPELQLTAMLAELSTLRAKGA